MFAWGALAAAFGRARRVPRKGFTQLLSKQGNKNFYKGKGAIPTGRHTRKGKWLPCGPSTVCAAGAGWGW
jgi:large subunit ribosomal protein L41